MKSNSELLVDYELFKDETGKEYISLEVNGIVCVFRLGSKKLHDTLFSIAVKKKLMPFKQNVNAAIEQLEVEMVLVTDIKEVNTRYAKRNGAIYIFLGDGDNLIKISDDGVKRTRNKSIRFVSSIHRGKLPYEKEIKCSMEHFLGLLWKYIPVRSEKDRLLLLAYMLDCCFTDTDYQILLITGSSGSGKSSTTTLIRSMIDPSTFGMGSLLKSPKDIYLAAVHNYLLTFDNNGNNLNSETQNLLCQACTGGNYVERELYTNNDPVITKLKNPVIINGLQSPFTQDDVLNRVIHIQLPPLTNEDYAKTGGKNNWQNQFEADLPKMLSGFYGLLQRVLVLKNKVRTPPELPRMGDFAKIGIALERALGLEKGSFIKAYENKLNYGASTILEDSELAQALISLTKNLREPTTYTRLGLIQLLKNYTHSASAIPDKSRAFRTELDKVEKPLLKLWGIKIEHINKTRDGAKVIITPTSKKSKSK